MAAKAAPRDGDYPRIAGKPQEYLYRQLRNFRKRRRGYAPMTQLVKLLSDDYLREIAAFSRSSSCPTRHRPHGMPPFAQSLSNAALSTVLGDVRNAWRNQAPALAELDVAR